MSVSPATSTLPLSATNILNVGGVPVKAKASTSSGSSSSAGGGLTGTNAGTTFLNLLVKELQNQDPTSPMDSTAMVGQMISLNQLDELISINQTLGSVTKSSSSPTPHTGKAQDSSNSESSASMVATRAALMNAGSPAGYLNSTTSTATDPSSTLDFSQFTQFGGK